MGDAIGYRGRQQFTPIRAKVRPGQPRCGAPPIEDKGKPCGAADSQPTVPQGFLRLRHSGQGKIVLDMYNGH